jgi:hypothetical protein
LYKINKKGIQMNPEKFYISITKKKWEECKTTGRLSYANQAGDKVGIILFWSLDDLAKRIGQGGDEDLVIAETIIKNIEEKFDEYGCQGVKREGYCYGVKFDECNRGFHLVWHGGISMDNLKLIPNH